MNKIKTIFTIKDLENLSGIKAHTIRIWEKRYAVFNPDRGNSNERLYTLEELQKLFNVVFLYNFGYKISKIAKFDQYQLQEAVKQVYNENSKIDFALHDFKIAMLTFDTFLFAKAYNDLLKKYPIDYIFEKVFVPFLYEIGVLWQTSTIRPIHEHFISSLIFQKLAIAVNELELSQNFKSKEIDYILFLPDNEIHEIALMYLNLRILSKGYKTLYLGISTPFTDLEYIASVFPKASFVSYFSVLPEADQLTGYLEVFHSKIISKNKVKFLISGNQVNQKKSQFSDIIFYDTYTDLINSL